jgi:2Fe-2S ferredoxin
MAKLIVTTTDGETWELDYSAGATAMEVIREAGIDEMTALCGGVLSCATCHVHVDPACSTLIPEMSEDENDLLDSSDHRDTQSRLSCQIRLTDELSGLRLKIAEPD